MRVKRGIRRARVRIDTTHNHQSLRSPMVQSVSGSFLLEEAGVRSLVSFLFPSPLSLHYITADTLHHPRIRTLDTRSLSRPLPPPFLFNYDFYHFLLRSFLVPLPWSDIPIFTQRFFFLSLFCCFTKPGDITFLPVPLEFSTSRLTLFLFYASSESLTTHTHPIQNKPPSSPSLPPHSLQPCWQHSFLQQQVSCSPS